MAHNQDMTDDELPQHPTVLGTHEVARLLGVPRDQVDKWRRRGGVRGRPFPAPRWLVGNRPAWDRVDVEAWAGSVGRAVTAG